MFLDSVFDGDYESAIIFGISTLYWPPPSFFDFMLPTGFLGAENDGTEDKTWRSTTYS